MRRGALVLVAIVAVGLTGVVIGRSMAPTPSTEPMGSLSPSAQIAIPTETPTPASEVGIVGTIASMNFFGEEWVDARWCRYMAGVRVLAEDGQGTFLGQTTTSKAITGYGSCSVEFILQVPKAPMYVLNFGRKGASFSLRLVYTYQELRRTDFRIHHAYGGD